MKLLNQWNVKIYKDLNFFAYRMSSIFELHFL